MRDIKYRGQIIGPADDKQYAWMTTISGITHYSNDVMWLMERIDDARTS